MSDEKGQPLDQNHVLYDKGTMRVVIFACISIVLAVMITGSVSYFVTQDAVIKKIKSQDMVYIIESITAKIDGRIERAKETSLVLAKDPASVQWIVGSETDQGLGEYVKKNITNIAHDYDYANAFIVSGITKNYWAEDSALLHVMSDSNPDDNWFFSSLKDSQVVKLNIDYNKERGGETFVFVNTLMGDPKKPIGVAGVGLSLKEIAKEFQSYKFGEESSLWLVDHQGKIHLSENIEQNGMYLNDFIPPNVVGKIIENMTIESVGGHVIEYVDAKGETVDLIYRETKSTNWKVVFKMPRRESVGILNHIKWGVTLISLVSLLLIVFVFYFISNRIANPFKRAVLLAQEMENQVKERTKELTDKNREIMDSIEYAQRIQEGILPPVSLLADVFTHHFIIWKPRDRVGGDFYWARKIDDRRSLIAVIDCTGHGVPGAFMTMAVNSILDHIVDSFPDHPDRILSELNQQVKNTLHQKQSNEMTDDGLDIGICYVEDKKRLLFAGAKISLYVKRSDQVYHIKGDRQSVGYRRSPHELEFVSHEWMMEAGDVFYMTSDGYIDQNGGEKDYSFGRKRFIQAITDHEEIPLAQQKQAFEDLLIQYRGKELQRDDITVVGFSF